MSRIRNLLSGWWLLVALVGTSIACDSGNPVAPVEGAPGAGSSDFAVTVTADPPELQAGAGAPATLTIKARALDTNQSPANGTTVIVSTNVGSLGSNDPAAPVTVLELTFSNGQATTSFFAPDEVTTATVLAQIGASVGELNLPVLEVLASNFFVTGVSPNFGDPEGGESVTVQGAGFKQPLRVTFGGSQASIVSVTSNAIEVITPESIMPVVAGSALLVDVAVTNTLNEAMPPTDTLTGGYTYTKEELPAFFVREVSPNAGGPDGGELVSIIGGGFRSPVRVEFGSKVAVEPVVVDDEEISVIVPAPDPPVPNGERQPVSVTVFNALNDPTPASISVPGGYTYIGDDAPIPLTVTSMTPSTGTIDGGTTVTLTGLSFESPVAVELAGIRQSEETVLDSTELTFVTVGASVGECPPDGLLAQTGVTVTNLSTGETATVGLTFQYVLDAPRIDRISPTSGSQLGNTTLNIEGSGFTAPVQVVLSNGTDDFAATVQSVSDSLVQVSTPRVPDTFFSEVDCVTADEEPGKQYVNTTVSVLVTNVDSGCSDTFPNAFTYRPTNTSCRTVPAGGGE